MLLIEEERLYPEISDVNQINISSTRKITTYDDVMEPEVSSLYDSDADFEPVDEIIPTSEYVQQIITIFIDRSGKYFEYILNFLRNGCQIPKSLLPSSVTITEEILLESKFYNISELTTQLERHLRQLVMTLSLGFD